MRLLVVLIVVFLAGCLHVDPGPPRETHPDPPVQGPEPELEPEPLVEAEPEPVPDDDGLPVNITLHEGSKTYTFRPSEMDQNGSVKQFVLVLDSAANITVRTKLDDYVEREQQNCVLQSISGWAVGHVLMGWADRNVLTVKAGAMQQHETLADFSEPSMLSGDAPFIYEDEGKGYEGTRLLIRSGSLHPTPDAQDNVEMVVHVEGRSHLEALEDRPMNCGVGPSNANQAGPSFSVGANAIAAAAEVSIGGIRGAAVWVWYDKHTNYEIKNNASVWIGGHEEALDLSQSFEIRYGTQSYSNAGIQFGHWQSSSEMAFRWLLLEGKVTESAPYPNG